MGKLSWLSVLALVSSGAAKADWVEASSEHFVVYANTTEGRARTFSQQLERYHAAIAKIVSIRLAPPSPSNRVTVYVVSGNEQVRRLYGEGSRYIGGFYLPRAGGSLAIVPAIDIGTNELPMSMITLLHEYAHHYLVSSSSFQMPRWYSEGSAEFLSSASFPGKGGVGLGKPANHRAAELLLPAFARDVQVGELLDPPAQRDKRKGYDSFYGKSWLLFHYLVFEPKREGQLNAYLGGLAEGKSSREAALAAFGDFGQLERELDAYLRKSRMMMFMLPPEMVQPGAVTIRRLSAGEAAIMPVRIRSKRGVNDELAKAVLTDAREVAARYPDDPAVLAALSEAEHDAGNDAESVAAADKALAKDPKQLNAYVQKGLSLFRIAADAPDKTAAYAKARAPFMALNKIENDHPLPLIYYYRSFIEQGKRPSAVALQGLQRASELAPFDLGLRMTLAYEQIRQGHAAEARLTLAPVAFNPHGGGLSAAAQRVLAKLDRDPAWNGHDMQAIAGETTESEGDE
jgi:tetratricopeptide (TPR) repeat protein